MSQNYHTPIVVGESNSPATINSRLSALDTVISSLSRSGSLVTYANGAASAGQDNVAVGSSAGLHAGMAVVYNLAGGAVEINEIDYINSATSINLVNNIGSGGIADGAIIAVESPDTAAARGNYDTLGARTNGIDRLPGAMRMGAAASASATSITLRTAPNTVGADYGWLAIDPFTTQCEIRKIASISDTTIDLHVALDYSHSADDAVLWMPTLKLSIELFGAKGDFSTDDTAAIQRAADVAAALITDGLTSPPVVTGIIIDCGPGQFMLSDGIIFLSRVTFRGCGNATVFRAMSGFPADTAMFEIGDSAGEANNAFDSRLENLTIDGENYADIGVYSELANELSGLLRVYVRDCMDYGIKFEGGTCINWTMRDVYVLMRGANASAVGIYIDTGFGTSRGMDSITSNSDSSPNIAANIQLERCCGMMLSRIHTENGADGILIGDVGACSGVHISGFLPAGNTNGVRISDNSANAGIVLNALHKPSSTTNLLVDEIAGYTHTGSSISHYMRGQFMSSRGNRQLLDGWDYTDLPADLSATQMNRFGQSTVIRSYYFSRPGSITGLGVASNQTRTAGSLTVTMYKNGSPTALTVGLDGTDTQTNETLVAPATYTFSAGDRFTLYIESSSWGPTTADIAVSVEIET